MPFTTALTLCAQLVTAHAASNCVALPTVQAPREGRLASMFDWTVSSASFLTADGSKAIIIHAAMAAYPWARTRANKQEADMLDAVRNVGDPMMGLFTSDFGHVIVEKFGTNDVAYPPAPAEVRIQRNRPCFVDPAVSTWVDGLKKVCWPKGFPCADACYCVPLEGKDPT